MDPSLEIRKLLPSHVRELASILETHELWKRLMTIIPKILHKTNFQCDITNHNSHKYNSEHFRLIENESEKSRRTCTEILFDEWGTSGRIRPALGHLLYLSTKANLFRAADYIAVDLLKQEKPKRPSVGPEAEISVNLSELLQASDDEFEKVLDNIDYVSDAVNLIRTYSDKTPKRANRIPEIVITPDIDENINVPKINVPVVVQRTKSTEEISSMIKFSTTQVENSVQEASAGSDISNNNNLDSVYQSNATEDNISGTQELNMPNLSIIMGKNVVVMPEETISSTESSISNSIFDSSSQISENSESKINSESLITDSFNPAFSQIMDKPCENVPNLSILNLESKESIEKNVPLKEPILKSDMDPKLSEENMIPDLDILQQQSGEQSTNLPDFSALQIDNTNLNPGSHSNITINNTSHVSSDSSLKTRSCSSPLPNLSLDTILPHYSYQNLELATHNFNSEQYKGENSEGRFLGKGEFGTVFLALKLLDRPVAVKKLNIGDVEIVNIDDDVTIQFRNEVEVLSKYKHENLLSLLGYSCDGCTYCLMYEYIPGGALRDRLQDINNQLFWKQRLNIAWGTSKAISYLHNAFSSPLIHTDIKSANILLDSNEQPKLCDFGLIKLIPNQNISLATNCGTVGTSAYMPKEAFDGDISIRLDTFSFGVVLLELLTSLPPIDNEGTDLVTHVGETIEDDDVTPLVDCKAGSWTENSINYASKLYEITRKCLEEKKRRPTMLEVKMTLDDTVREINH